MIKIEITGDTPLEALASLTAFGIHCLQNEDVHAAADHILKAEQHDTRKTASAPTPLPAPVSASNPTPGSAETPGPAAPKFGPGAPPTEDPTPPAVSADDAPAPAPTVAEVRERGIEASRKYGKEAIVAILQKFNVSGMSAIKEKDRAAFLAELDKLDTEKAGEVDA